MDKTEYAPVREPTSDEWRIREVWIYQGQSVAKAAFELGVEGAEVIRAVDQCRWWREDSGWTAEYALSRRTGFGESDSRMRADIVASYNTREAQRTK